MDTLCGIGLPELVILALLAFVVIGPSRTQQLALTFGRWLGKAMRAPWWREFTDVTKALRNLPTTLVRMAELEDAQAELNSTLKDIESSARVTVDDDDRPAPKTDPWGLGESASEAIEKASEKAPAEPPQAEEPSDTPEPDNKGDEA